MITFESFTRKCLRKLILTGCYSGPLGVPGRLIGSAGFWRIRGGPRIIIDRPSEYIQREILCHGVYERQVANAIAYGTNAGESFFDIGANIGQHSLLAGYRGINVHAFEAVPRIAAKVRANVALNRLESRVQVFECAISDEIGTAVMYEAERIDDGSHSLIEGIPATSIKLHSVKQTTVDAHIADCNVIPAVLKIDVEGAEAKVLDGASNTLDRVRPVVVLETADRVADRIGESAASVLRRLFDRSYRLFRIDEREQRFREIVRDEVRGELANYVAIPGESAKLSKFVTADYHNAATA